MKRFYQENNLLKNYDRELFDGDAYLNNAADIKLNMRKKYLITKADTYIEIERKENTMNMNTSDVYVTTISCYFFFIYIYLNIYI